MKKQLLTLLLILITSICFSQKKAKDTAKVHLNLKDNLVFYEKIIDSLESDKEMLFNTSLRWMAETFNDSKEVIQLKDKESGIITGSGNFKYSIPGFIGDNGTIGFMIDLTVKDKKSRIRLYQFTHDYPETRTSNAVKIPIEKRYMDYLAQKKFPTEGKKYHAALSDNIEQILQSYTTYLKTKSGKDDF